MATYKRPQNCRSPKFLNVLSSSHDRVVRRPGFKKVEIDENKAHFEVPKEYDFQKAFNQTFGIIKDEKFEVEAEFTGWAAVFVEERIWSNDQVITRDGEKVRIKFTSSSEPEIISWVLSFGDQARLLGPHHLVERLAVVISSMCDRISPGIT